jgi:hypothetical protein
MKANFILIVLAVVLGLAIAAGSAKATTNYMYPWPTSFKQTVILSCSANGDILYCGCVVRKLRTRWTYSTALYLGTRVTNGDVIPARYLRDMRWATSIC